jgi:hypothetical protein
LSRLILSNGIILLSIDLQLQLILNKIYFTTSLN